MNKQNAIHLLFNDLVVLNVTFENVTKENLLNNTPRQYTYLARESWDTSMLVPGDKLLVPVGSFCKPKVVTFVDFGDLADLDLDSHNIEYKYIIGQIPQEFFDRYETQQREVAEMERQINRQRIASIRESVKAKLLTVDDTE